MKRRTAKILHFVNIGLMMIAMIICAANYWKAGMYIVALIALGISLYLNQCLRCKHCGRWPRKGDWMDKYCPKCGEPYEE